MPDLRDAFRKQALDAVGKRGVDLVLVRWRDVFDACLRVMAHAAAWSSSASRPGAYPK
jgi:hypothetical protein